MFENKLASKVKAVRIIQAVFVPVAMISVITALMSAVNLLIASTSNLSRMPFSSAAFIVAFASVALLSIFGTFVAKTNRAMNNAYQNTLKSLYGYEVAEDIVGGFAEVSSRVDAVSLENGEKVILSLRADDSGLSGVLIDAKELAAV